MGRINAVLAVSRAFGDYPMKKFVMSEPTLTEVELSEEDSFILVCCDGIWDVISDDDAASTVLENHTTCQAAAVALRDQSLKKGTSDNVSVLVVKL